jgi:cytidylate kinase
LPRPTICISRSIGAEGETVGRAVADRLGYRYVDEEVIDHAAERAELEPAVVADVERRKSTVARLLELMGEGAVSPLGVAPPEAVRAAVPEADLRRLITDVIRALADEGSVVIVAHAASFALEGDDVLRVLVTGSPDRRAARISASEEIDERAAAKVIRDDDAARADYLNRFYKIRRELPTHFDIVINTDTLTPEVAAEVITHAARH